MIQIKFAISNLCVDGIASVAIHKGKFELTLTGVDPIELLDSLGDEGIALLEAELAERREACEVRG